MVKCAHGLDGSVQVFRTVFVDVGQREFTSTQTLIGGLNQRQFPKYQLLGVTPTHRVDVNEVVDETVDQVTFYTL